MSRPGDRPTLRRDRGRAAHPCSSQEMVGNSDSRESLA
jgi:hypothetical protein